MKTILVLCCIFVFTAMGHADMEEKVYEELLSEHIASCANELQIETPEIGKLDDVELQGEERTKFGCLKACVLKRLKVLEDGALKVESFQEILEKVYPDNPEMISLKMEIMTKCVEEVKEKADECDLAYEWARCTKINATE